jgi:hypothetical protein
VLGRNDNVKHLYIEKPQPCDSPIASHFHPRAAAHRALRNCEACASHVGVIVVSAMRNRAEILAFN